VKFHWGWGTEFSRERRVIANDEEYVVSVARQEGELARRSGAVIVDPFGGEFAGVGVHDPHGRLARLGEAGRRAERVGDSFRNVERWSPARASDVCVVGTSDGEIVVVVGKAFDETYATEVWVTVELDDVQWAVEAVRSEAVDRDDERDLLVRDGSVFSQCLVSLAQKSDDAPISGTGCLNVARERFAGNARRCWRSRGLRWLVRRGIRVVASFDDTLQLGRHKRRETGCKSFRIRLPHI